MQYGTDSDEAPAERRTRDLLALGYDPADPEGSAERARREGAPPHSHSTGKEGLRAVESKVAQQGLFSP